MKKYFLVPYQAYAEGDYVSSKAVIVKASSARAVIDSLDQDTHEGWFPPELVVAMETDTFGGSSVERGDSRFYYVAGNSESEDDEETPLYIVSYGEPQPYDSFDDAMAAALKQGVYGPLYYAVDARGGLHEVQVSSELNPETKQRNVASTRTSVKYHRLNVALDDGPEFAAWSTGDTWNGWDTPYFEKKEADAVIAYFASMDEDVGGPHKAYYDKKRDTYVIQWYPSTDEGVDEWSSEMIATPEGKKKVYDIGRRSYTWADWSRREEIGWRANPDRVKRMMNPY